MNPVLPSLAAALALAGCAQLDPLTRSGEWRPTGANAKNLAAMVAVPSDLVHGVAARTSDGNRAARAMARLRTDRVYPLPDVGVSKLGREAAATPAVPAAGAAE